MDSVGHRKKIENALSKLEELVEELKVLKCELVESEERFRLVAEFAYDWEYWQDADGTYKHVSPSCESITGYTPEDFLQNKDLLMEIIHPEDMDKWQNHIHKITDTGELEPLELRIIAKSGDIRWIYHVCRKVYGKNGEKRGVRGSNRDITIQKELQEEVRILKGYLPICSSCKKIRDDNGYWNQIEAYILDHSEAVFSHSICPDCMEKLYPDLEIGTE